MDLSDSHIFQQKHPILFTNSPYKMSDLSFPLATEYIAQQIEHENYVITLSYIHSLYFNLLKISGASKK